MIGVSTGVRIWVSAAPIDFRAGMDSLAALVQREMKTNPFGGDVFVFRSKRADRVKILLHDDTGLALYQKRLEAGHFFWPPVRDGVVTLSPVQLAALLDGLEWKRVSPMPVARPKKAH